MEKTKYTVEDLPLIECELRQIFSLSGVLSDIILENAPLWETKEGSEKYNTLSKIWAKRADDVNALTSTITMLLSDVINTVHSIAE